MPFQKGHTINNGRVRDEFTKQSIGEKNSLKLKCPHCDLITIRARLAHHITLKHPNDLQYNNFNDFFIQSLIVGEEEYQKYLIEKTTIELQRKLNRKFTKNYLAENE
jgi:hypothetical protein